MWHHTPAFASPATASRQVGESLRPNDTPHNAPRSPYNPQVTARQRGRAPRERTNVPDKTLKLAKAPTAYKVMHMRDPKPSDVAILAEHRILEVAVSDPRRHIIIGLLAVIRSYMQSANPETAKRRDVIRFRDVINAIARRGIPAQNFLSRTRDAVPDAKEFRVAVEAVLGRSLLGDREDDSDDTSFMLAREAILEAFKEPDLSQAEADEAK